MTPGDLIEFGSFAGVIIIFLLLSHALARGVERGIEWIERFEERESHR